jgi:hypothetical protein
MSSAVTQAGAPSGTAAAGGLGERLFCFGISNRSSKESAFDLVSVDGPIGLRLFFAAVQLQIRARADLLNEAAK